MRFAANGEALNAELEAGGDFLQRRLGAFAAGQAVGDNADVVAALCLSVGEVQDVTERFRRPARAPRAGYEAAGPGQRP